MFATQQEDRCLDPQKGTWQPKCNSSALEAETGDPLNKLISQISQIGEPQVQ